ncbi:MAG: hypothetical protein Q8O75_00390 [bacterium]|nr:hypothetical protein [bacterium]
MNLKYSLRPRLTIKTYLFVYLLVLIVVSFVYTPIQVVWKSIVVAWTVAIIGELLLNALTKKIVRIPDSALITATIIPVVLATSTSLFLISLAVLIALFTKHFIRFRDKHIFNPANIAIFLMIYIFGQNIQWWGASNVIIIVILGLLVMYKLRRVWPPIIFLTVYFLLLIFSTDNISLEAIKTTTTSDYSPFFFAFVMLPEPQTAAGTAKGRIVNSVLVATFAVAFTLFNMKAPLIASLALVNLITPIVNMYSKRK